MRGAAGEDYNVLEASKEDKDRRSEEFERKVQHAARGTADPGRLSACTPPSTVFCKENREENKKEKEKKKKEKKEKKKKKKKKMKKKTKMKKREAGGTGQRLSDREPYGTTTTTTRGLLCTPYFQYC